MLIWAYRKLEIIFPTRSKHDQIYDFLGYDIVGMLRFVVTPNPGTVYVIIPRAM